MCEDVVLLGTHTGTHLDALAHLWYGEQFFNGYGLAAPLPSALQRPLELAPGLGDDTRRILEEFGAP